MKTLRIVFRVLVMWAACVSAAHSESAPIPLLTLKNHRILHNATVQSDRPATVIIRCQEGLVQVAKADLPDDLAAKYPVRAAAAEPVREATATPKPAPKPKQDLRFGCSFSMEGVKGDLVTLEIRNQSAAIATIRPDAFVARTPLDELLPGVDWVKLDEDGRVAMILKHRQLIAAGDTVTLVLMVGPKPHEAAIDTVQWAR